jgi:hypothetical protein
MSRHRLPSATWPESFAKSKLVSIYVRELYFLAHRVHERCLTLFSKHPPNTEKYYAAADYPSLELAFGVLSDASRFRDLLFPNNKKPLYHARAQHLRTLLDGLDYSALIDKKVRNTLEHFDEYLDDANLIHSSIPPKVLYAVAFNFVFSHLYRTKDTTFPFPTYISPIDGITVFPVRVYDVSKTTVHNFFWSIDLSPISTQAADVKVRLATLIGEDHPEDWISCLYTVGPTGA